MCDMAALSTVDRTRLHFAEIADDCAKQAKEGVFFVNDVDEYVASCVARKASIMNGECDHTFTFKQYAHYLETGESIPFMTF